MLKRLQVIYPSRKVRIINDNTKYEPAEVNPDQIKINGKVIWFGREFERKNMKRKIMIYILIALLDIPNFSLVVGGVTPAVGLLRAAF
jgi:hypothetical protein